jgi:Flp pilus assembly protein CpaB
VELKRTDGKTMRPGGAAPRELARRRQWIRRLAIVLACLTAGAALSQASHRGASRPPGVAAVVVRHSVRAGQYLRPSDLAVVVREPGAGGPAAFGRAEDAAGRVAVRGLRAGEVVTPETVVPVLRYYGVAARVPRGMRAINLVVPSAATFGGELAPWSRVDLLAAFELGQERAAATLLTSGIILRVAPDSVGQAGLGDRLPGAAAGDTGHRGDQVELEVAVPLEHEREVALAQAFGRVFVTVHSLAADGAATDSPGVVNLRKYLNLPAVTPMSAAAPPPPPLWLRPPTAPSPRGGRVRSAVHSLTPRAAAPGARPGSPSTPAWTVDLIEGVRRSTTEVPRAGSAGNHDLAPVRREPAREVR